MVGSPACIEAPLVLSQSIPANSSPLIDVERLYQDALGS